MSNGSMDALQSLKIKSICCRNCILLDQLLEVVGSSSHDELTNMEISSPTATHRLAQLHLATICRRFVSFKADVPEMRIEVVILTSLERLRRSLKHIICVFNLILSRPTSHHAGLRTVDGWSHLSKYGRVHHHSAVLPGGPCAWRRCRPSHLHAIYVQ